jgi:hypothetical protein
MRRCTLLALALGTVIPMTAQSASSIPAQVVDAAKRDAIVTAALVPAETELGAKVRLGVRSVASDGDWAFVLADLEEPGGAPFDYSKSPLAEQAKRGLVSHRYAALLRQRDGKWTVVTERVGPTDPAWLGWSDRYGAPKDLFATPD